MPHHVPVFFFGNAASGLIAATGALNVAFSDGLDPYLHRGRRMLGASLCCGLAVFAGGFTQPHHALTVMVTAVCAFAAGMMVETMARLRAPQPRHRT